MTGVSEEKRFLILFSIMFFLKNRGIKTIVALEDLVEQYTLTNVELQMVVEQITIYVRNIIYMSRKKIKVNSLVKEMVDDQALSGPAPDAELTSVGQDMFWFPDNVKPIKKLEVVIEDDPMLSIL